QLRAPVVAGHVAVAVEEVEAAAGVPVGSLEREELPVALADLARLESMVCALKLQVLAESDRRRLAEDEAATGTPAWAAKLTGSTRALLAGGLYFANLLDEKYHAARAAFADGGIELDQVKAIVRAAEKIPAAATDQEREDAEAALVAKAVNGMNARGLRQAGRRMLERINRRLADEQEAGMLEDENDEAEVKTSMYVWDNGDGTFSGKFTIPELHGQLLKSFLENLSSPRRYGLNKAGEPVTDESVQGTYNGLSYYEKLGAAFTELLEHMPTKGFGGVAATMIVKIDHDRLIDGLGSAGLDTGVNIATSAARRLSCNAGILPAVLGGRSEILDLGRTRRLHSKAQRNALSLRYDTCAAEGCERPFAWCDIHHPHAWSQGGPTDLDNGLPLCGHHHRRAHDRRYDMRILPTGEARFHYRR
ncbi:MAG: DUF222 domain-containing protein, partial [Nocardioides sp.]